MCLLDCMAKAHVYLQVPGTRPLRGRARRARGLCARTCTTRLGTSRACAHTVRQGDILCVRCVVSVRSRCRATVHTINVPTYQGRGMVPRSMCPPIRGLGWYLDQCAHLSGAWDGTSINVPTYQGCGMVPRSMCPPIRGVGWYLDQCAHLSGAWDGTVLRGKYTYDVKADLKWVVAAIRGANLAKEPWKSNAYFCGILPPAGTASLLSP